MDGFCTFLMHLMTTLSFTVFSTNVSISWYSDEVEVNETLLHCSSDSIEDHWLGTLALVAFLPAFWLPDGPLRDLQQTKMFYQFVTDSLKVSSKHSLINMMKQHTLRLKVKNDHRSKFSNLSNWREEAWKNQGFNGIRTRRDTGAMLYQLSYEATHWERGQLIEFISSREEWNDVKYIWNNLYLNYGCRWKWSCIICVPITTLWC